MTTVSHSSTRKAHADVIGDVALAGKLISAGEIMKRIDLVGASACRHVSNKACVTVAIDTFKMERTLFHGDFVRLEAIVNRTGKSSLVTQVSAYRHDTATQEFQLACNAILTFVAIDENGKPTHGLPVIAYPEEQVMQAFLNHRNHLDTKWKSAIQKVEEIVPITSGIVQQFKRDHQMPLNHLTQLKVDIQDTTTELCGGFLYKDANALHQVFGGVIISWMDRAAVQCARKLTKNMYMATIGISRLHFKLPILVSDEIIVRAQVCHVRTFVFEIEVAVYRSLPFKPPQHSHSGYFSVINVDEKNQPMRVQAQVYATETDQDGMRAILQALHWQVLEKKDQVSQTFPIVPIRFMRNGQTQSELASNL